MIKHWIRYPVYHLTLEIYCYSNLTPTVYRKDEHLNIQFLNFYFASSFYCSLLSTPCSDICFRHPLFIYFSKRDFEHFPPCAKIHFLILTDFHDYSFVVINKIYDACQAFYKTCRLHRNCLDCLMCLQSFSQ